MTRECIVDGGIVFTIIRKGKNVAVLHSSAQAEVEKIVEPGSILSTEDDSIDAIFSRYHRTRNLPFSADAACLENFTNKCRENIAHLEGHVAKLQQDVFQLCQQIAESLAIIDQQQGQIGFTRSLQAPIRSLPTETLDMIFEFALSQSKQSLGYGVTDRTSPPIVVSQVCKLWRDVALQNSKLWSSPRIVIREESPKALSSQQHLFELFMERSQSRALNLCIVNARYPRIARDSPGHRQLLGKASRAFPRCTSLEIHVQSPGIYLFLAELDDATTTWPDLRDLLICSDVFIWNTPRLKLFRSAPKLNRLRLNVGSTLGLGSIVLPYRRLKKFWCRIRLLGEELPAQALEVWQQLVWRCVKARDLMLDFSEKDSTRIPIRALQPTKDVVLNNVRSMSITNGYSGNADLILCAFTLPSLNSLFFDFARASHFIPKSKTASQIGVSSYFNLTKHFANITALMLLRVSIEDDDLLELFKSAPRVSHLNLLNLTNHVRSAGGPQPSAIIRPNDKHLIHLLSTMTATSHQDEGSFLPYLTFVNLYYPYEEENRAERAEAYASMAKARARMNQNAVESGSRQLVLDGPNTHFEFYLSFREGTKTADDIRTVTEAMDNANLEPPHLIFKNKTLPNFNKVPEEYTDDCSRVRLSDSSWSPL